LKSIKCCAVVSYNLAVLKSKNLTVLESELWRDPSAAGRAVRY